MTIWPAPSGRFQFLMNNNEYQRISDNWVFYCRTFSIDVSFSIEVSILCKLEIVCPHNIQIIYVCRYKIKLRFVKGVWYLHQDNFRFTSRYSQDSSSSCQLSDFFPKYGDKILVYFSMSSMSTIGYWQTWCLWCKSVKSRFDMDLKSNIALKIIPQGSCVGQITRRIDVIYEQWIKLTWRRSKFAVEKVNF